MRQYPVTLSRSKQQRAGISFCFLTDAGAADRIIIVASAKARQLLDQLEKWYRDGVFKICQEIFYLLYTFRAQYNGRIFPCIFVFLLNKTKAFYRSLIIAISNLTNGRFLFDILIDFERGAINAIQAVFANSNVNGCFLHLCPNLRKRVQNVE